jgi:hypothetical protein
MFRNWLGALLAGCLLLACWLTTVAPAQAQSPADPRFFYYPYYYFPHNYWPAQGPQWPEPIGAPYRPAPAWMATPAFREPAWRYEWWQSQRYYSGFHFWLDQF